MDPPGNKELLLLVGNLPLPGNGWGFPFIWSEGQLYGNLNYACMDPPGTEAIGGDGWGIPCIIHNIGGATFDGLTGCSAEKIPDENIDRNAFSIIELHQ